MDVLSSRILPRPSDLDRSRRFYRDLLGLAVYREFGPPDDPGLVIWIQVGDVHAEHARLAAAGVPIMREPVTEPWGLTEMWIQDPDGIQIVRAGVPAGHPLRRQHQPRRPPAASATASRSACGARPGVRPGRPAWKWQSRSRTGRPAT